MVRDTKEGEGSVGGCVGRSERRGEWEWEWGSTRLKGESKPTEVDTHRLFECLEVGRTKVGRCHTGTHDSECPGRSN